MEIGTQHPRLDRRSSFGARLCELESRAAAMLGESGKLRFAVAVYDQASDLLHTFADNSAGSSTLSHYSIRLSEVPSLAFATQTGGDRIVDDLAVFAPSGHTHTEQLLAMGFRASYARAIHMGDKLIGIAFANSTEPGFFTAWRLERLDPYMRLVGLHLAIETSCLQTFSAAITSAHVISAYRDTDTAEHLTRMSHFCAIIADGVAAKYGLGDEFVAKIFQFAPMHDIGKIGVPDSILLKPGKLTPDEFEAMKAHVRIGVDMVDRIVDDVGLGGLPGVSMLRNMVRCHHEKLDGSGYPDGLAGEDLPIEAQILAVADIFDALTSARPYKAPWPVEQALAELERLAPAKLNADCVAVLRAEHGRVREVVERFADRPVAAD
jgi:HD-GYP domain-containing protein (c-di-GMP phosphodiesterase class II)